MYRIINIDGTIKLFIRPPIRNAQVEVRGSSCICIGKSFEALSWPVTVLSGTPFERNPVLLKRTRHFAIFLRLKLKSGGKIDRAWGEELE